MLQASSTPTAITLHSGLVTYIEVLTVEPERQAVLVEQMRQFSTEFLAHQPGFVSASVHRSWDRTHALSYIQWNDEDSFERARTAPAFEEYTAGLLKLGLSLHRDRYDVVYTDDHTPAGVTTIVQDYAGDTFINVISTTPERQEGLVTFVTGNDAQVFAVAPGYRSANFHRSHDGTRVINYSHWDNQQSFLDAINAMFQVPGLTMEQANALATKIAAGQGQTDFRFYEVVLSIHTAAKQV